MELTVAACPAYTDRHTDGLTLPHAPRLSLLTPNGLLPTTPDNDCLRVGTNGWANSGPTLTRGRARKNGLCTSATQRHPIIAEVGQEDGNEPGTSTGAVGRLSPLPVAPQRSAPSEYAQDTSCSAVLRWMNLMLIQARCK